MSDAAWAAVADALGVQSGMRVLDVGCGGGGFCTLAAARGAQASGLDADPAAIARARSRLPGADLRVGIMEILPWVDDSFDAVAGFNAFQYALDIDLALREARRVCRPGGLVGVCKWGRAEENELFALAIGVGAGRPGALQVEDPVEAAMRRVGLAVRDRGDVPVVLELADVGALAGVIGADDHRRLVEQAAPFRQSDGGYRFAAGLTYVIAALPGDSQVPLAAHLPRRLRPGRPRRSAA